MVKEVVVVVRQQENSKNREKKKNFMNMDGLWSIYQRKAT